MADEKPYAIEVQKMVDWEQQVKSEEYYRALADGRCLRWRPIATRPMDRDVIVGRQTAGGRWFMLRCVAGDTNDHVHPGAPATHWCEDMLGTPYVVVRTSGLHLQP